MTDFSSAINAVQRHVGDRVLESGQARSVTLTRTFNSSVDDVWDACTNPERVPRWFLPVSGDLRLGGRYQLEGHAGGTIQMCNPPHGFSATWEFGGDVTWIELRLSAESAERTRFELEHIAHVDVARWLEYGPGAVGVGWDLLLAGLDVHLSTAQPLDPAEVATWTASDEGKQFISLSSEQWYAASVAAGTDASEARAAAVRTTAFYTGADPTAASANAD
ncbi:MAG TPA: SRPBCC family protein [Chloroflexota bacterium]|jgi:uncharacterized protein YndB with AHSA1/START domain